jgi:hypothetical protein
MSARSILDALPKGQDRAGHRLAPTAWLAMTVWSAILWRFQSRLSRKGVTSVA